MSMEKQKKPFTRALVILTIVAILLVCAMTAVYFQYYNTTPPTENVVYALQNKRIEYLPGVRVDGVSLGGLTEEEARTRVLDTPIPPLGTLTVASGEKQATVDLSSLLPERNVEKALADALALSDVPAEEREANEQMLKAENGRDFHSELKYDLSPLRGAIERAAVELSVDPVDAKVEILTEEQRAAKQAGSTGDPENTQREDGQLINIEDLVDFVDAVPGSRVDVDALYTAAQHAIDNQTLEQKVVVEGIPVEPEKTLESVKNNFSLISSANSSFSGGSYGVPNRVFNLQKASDILNGYVIQPGEEFSCNEAFGPRYASTGWKAAGAISNGKSVQEVGGGICQVSSTLYNTVLKADLEIVNRQPHSWPLSYLPAGQDATISTGGPDFIFKNDRSTPVVLVSNVDTNKKEITIQLFGEPLPDGIHIELRSEKTGTIPQPSGTTTTNPDAVRNGRAGSTYKTYKQYYKGDTMLREEFSYETRYRAFGSISMAGGGRRQKPAAELAEEAPQQEAPRAAESAPAEAPAAQPESIPVEEDTIIDIPEELE